MTTIDAKGTTFPIGEEEEFPLYFSEWLKRRRKQLDLTQAELAGRACCSVFALRKIEAGERRPSKQLAGMLAKALEIPGEDQTTFIKVARGELGIEKLLSLVSTSPPAGKSSTVLENLPRELTPFIGREPEITALTQLLQDPQCSLLTIVGPGGIGKTRLAIEAVHHSKDLFPDGTWFVSLVSLNSPGLIVPAIAEAVGFKFHDPTDLQSQLLRHLRVKKALLVLDNAEHLLEGTGVFTEIIKDCQQIKLLVTSRERLNLLSEWVFEIQGLPVPINDQVKQFDAYSSVALFLQSARRVQAGFEIQADERQWVLKICQIMEGMPLGIELSAAWVGLLSCEEIAKEIEHNIDFLSVSMRDLPERHRSLRATLDHSWNLLNTEEKLILTRLSVFHGGFSREAAQAICGASLPVLASLKNKTLLYRNDQDNYGLHEIIRQYAGLKLAELPDENACIKDQHALYFVQYLSDREEELKGLQQVNILNEMGRITDDLSQGWLHMVTHCQPSLDSSHSFPAELLHNALFSLSLFYEMRSRSLEAVSIFSESVTALKKVQAEFETTADAPGFKTVLGLVTAFLGLHVLNAHTYDVAKEYIESAINYLGDEQFRVERAQAMLMLASTSLFNGQILLAVTLSKQSREIFRQVGNEWWYALSSINLASHYYALGKLSEALELYQEVSPMVKPGDLRLKIPLSIGMAYILFVKKDFDKAEQLLQDTLPLCYQLHDVFSAVIILYYLGRVAYATHRLELAESYFLQSLNLQLEFGDSYNLAMIYIHLGNCLAARRDYDSAHNQYRQVIRIGQAIKNFDLVYFAQVFIARLLTTQGQTGQALEIFLLLRACSIERKNMLEEFDNLQAELQAALPEGRLEAAIQVEGKTSSDEAIAQVLAYAQAHECG